MCIHDCAIYFFKFESDFGKWSAKKHPHIQNMLDCCTLFNINTNKNNNFLTHFGTNLAQCVKKIFMGHVNLSPRHNLVYCSAAVYYYTLLMNHIEKSTIRKSDSLEFSQWNWQISVFDRLRLTWHMSVPDRKLAHIGRCGQHWAFVVVFLNSSFEGHIWYFRGYDK